MPRGKKIENKKNNEVKKPKRTELKVKVAVVNSKRAVKKEAVKKNQPVESRKRDRSMNKHMERKDYVEESINQEQEELEMEKLPEDVKGWVISEEAVEKKRAMDYIKIDHDKKIIMWSGVTFFMILIFGFWVFNINLVFKRQPISEAKSQLNIEDITENFNKTMEEINKNLNKYDGLKNASSSEISSSTDAVLPQMESQVSTSSEPVVTSEEINQLKMQLKELENRFSSSSNKNIFPKN